MPDRLPPSWGREPEDGRDLDTLLPPQAPLSVEELMADEALLSGQMTGISESQRPVAGAMFALRSAPVLSELTGEGAARAAFRAQLHHTLVLPLPAAGQDQGARPAARHRHRRRAAGGRGGLRVMALVGSAAAAVAIGVASLAGTFSGSAVHGGQSANSSAARQSPQAGTSASGTHQSVLGRGQPTKDPTSSTTPTASATPGAPPSRGVSPRHSELCREFFEDAFPSSPANQAKEKEVYDELSQIVGSKSPRKIAGYCVQQVGSWWDTHAAASSSWPGVPYSDGGSKDSPSLGKHDGQKGSGQASPAPSGGSGTSGPGSNGSGSAGSQ
jgi:hypothetical protein